VESKHLYRSSNSFSGTMSFNDASEMLRLRFAALSMTFFYYPDNNQQPTINTQLSTTN
jgi:hypothetical protein